MHLLLEEVGAIPKWANVSGCPADDDLLALVHREDYIHAVRQLSLPSPSAEYVAS